MNRSSIKCGLAVGTAAILAIAAVAPASAAPVLSNTEAVKDAAGSPAIDVRWGWGGWGWGGAVAAGVIGGLALGALASAPYSYGYGPYYGYGYAPAYGYGYGYNYGYSPSYSYGYAYAPSYGYTGGYYARRYVPRTYAYSRYRTVHRSRAARGYAYR